MTTSADDPNLTIYDSIDQGSGAWFEARRGIVTASVVGSMITPKTMKLANNDTSRGLIATLAAERITGHVEDTFMSYDMQRGVELEPYARDAYAEHYAPVEEVGFMTREWDGVRLGFSPDGLVGDDGLIEVKTRLPKIHINTIMADQVPAANMAQLQTGLLVTGKAWIDYISYSPGMHLWTKRVYPDEQWFEMIVHALNTAEAAVNELITKYNMLTKDLPMTERVELLEDMELKL